MNKTLIILRGLPGSGKSTLARLLAALLCCEYVEADMYFMHSGVYEFDSTKLGAAHAWCQRHVSSALALGRTIIVSNTSTTEKELEPYLDMAKEYDYNAISLVVENRHGGESVHDVPAEVLKKMTERFTFRL